MIAERATPLCRLPPGGTVVEYTAETTGISLALVASALDLKPNFAFSDAFSDEKTLCDAGLRPPDHRVASGNRRITKELRR